MPFVFHISLPQMSGNHIRSCCSVWELSESHHPLVFLIPSNRYCTWLTLLGAVYFPGPHVQVSMLFWCSIKLSMGLAAPVTNRSISPPGQHSKLCSLAGTFLFTISILLSCRNPAATPDVLSCSRRWPSHSQKCFSLSSLEMVPTMQKCISACQNAAIEVINSVEAESPLLSTD